MGEVEHFAFEALHVFERDVEEIARAAGRVEHAHRAQGVVEGVDLGQRGGGLAFVGEEQRGGLDVGPAFAQRLDDGGQDEAVDVGARGVVGAEGVALGGVEGAFEQGAEDGGFDLRPVGAGGLAQQGDLVAVERQDVGRLEQLAVEARQGVAQDDGEAAGVHLFPQRADERDELAEGALPRGGRRDEEAVEEVGECLPGQQADVLGEHREQAAGEEAGDALGVVAGAFEGLGDAGQLAGDGARGAGAGAGGVERQRVEPDGAQAGADAFVAQVGEFDAVRARVGERGVGGAAAREVGVELDAVADIEDDQEGRPALLGRQGAGVAFGLAAGAQHGVVEGLGRGAGADLLGLADGAGAPVAVDEAGAGAAVAVAEGDAALEDVGVVARVVAAPGRDAAGRAVRTAR